MLVFYCSQHGRIYIFAAPRPSRFCRPHDLSPGGDFRLPHLFLSRDKNMASIILHLLTNPRKTVCQCIKYCFPFFISVLQRQKVHNLHFQKNQVNGVLKISSIDSVGGKIYVAPYLAPVGRYMKFQNMRFTSMGVGGFTFESMVPSCGFLGFFEKAEMELGTFCGFEEVYR